MQKTFAVALHGGAGTRLEEYSEEELRQYQDSMARIIQLGQTMLASGHSAVDVVEQVVRELEDDPLYNAGVGATYTVEGRHELDAAIMDGRTKRGAAVACTTTVKNPVSLARLVMTETPHVLLIGEGAERFADAVHSYPKIERVQNDYFDTEFARRKWLEFAERQKHEATPAGKKGTVGCVAFDQQGNLAAATSTGGVYNKTMGRIGDTPILGAGTYANNETCAVSCTGAGELFILNNVSFHISALMAYQHLTLAEATERVVHHVLPADSGGLVAVDRFGNIAMSYNTQGLFRAAADSTGWLESKIGA
jgi:L-asparaginase / beta-aspartyl-peptidase